MKEKSQLIRQLINKHLPENVNSITDKEMDFREAVRMRVKFLLDNNLEILLHVLYRIDVAEPNVRKVLALEMPGRIDSALTDLIIDKLQQKIELRKKYS